MTYYFIMPEDRWHLELVIRQLKNFIIFPKMPNKSFELNPSFSALREAHGGNSVINNYFVLLSLMRLPFHSSHDTLGNVPRNSASHKIPQHPTKTWKERRRWQPSPSLILFCQIPLKGGGLFVKVNSRFPTLEVLLY